MVAHELIRKMKVAGRIIAHLERVYSITLLPCAEGDTPPGFLAGSEADGALLLFDAPDYQPKVIARSPGGYISIQPLIRDGRRYVVATTLFKPGFN